MLDLPAIQAVLNDLQIDGWLLYDFRGSNVLANRVLGIPEDSIGSRRFFYFIPRQGEPKKLVHRIESGALDHVPGDKIVYLRWQELDAGLANLLSGSQRVAMEYSPRNGNPYVSRVDAGTLEMVRECDVDVVSSGDLIQHFEARWTPEQWQQHLRADELNQQAFEMAWGMIRDRVGGGGTVRETEVQQAIMDFYGANNLTTYHPPIVGVNANGGDPHYAPQVGSDAEIGPENYVLLDCWCKLDEPNAVYSDLTKVGYTGATVPDEYAAIFKIVAAARDAGIDCVRNAFAQNQPVYGWQVDDATRKVIEDAGYGEQYIHRTGHSIGQETHGNGAHIDNLETHEDRRILTETCFSIEPGIYLPEFGVRSEVDVFVDGKGEVHVTGGLQTEVLAILG